MWGNVTSFPVAWKPPVASYSPVKAQTYPNSTYTPSAVTSRWPPVKWHHLRVTSCPVRSCDVISCHVTATSCEFQRCRSSNVPGTRLIRLLPPLPVDFESNDVTCGPLPVMWGHVTSSAVTWRPPPASFSPVGAKTYPKHDLYAFYSHFKVTSGQMTSLLGHFRPRQVTWRHFLSRDFRLVCYSPVKSQTYQKSPYTPSAATSRWLPVKWRHFLVTFGHVRARNFTSCEVTTTSCELKPLKKLKCTQKLDLYAFYSHFHVTSSQMTSLLGHFRSREITWRYFLSRDGNLLWVTAL